MPHDHTTAVPSPRVEAKAPPDPGCWKIRGCYPGGTWTFADEDYASEELARAKAEHYASTEDWLAYRIIHIPPEPTP